jgi:hypothetical protein
MFNIAEQPNEKLEAGVWGEYQGAKFLIAHAGNDKFQRSLNRLQKPFRRKIEKGDMDPAESRKIISRAMAEAILLDWKDVAKNGEAVSYSVELATMALNNDSQFREFVMEFSADQANFREEDLEHEGNS